MILAWYPMRLFNILAACLALIGISLVVLGGMGVAQHYGRTWEEVTGVVLVSAEEGAGGLDTIEVQVEYRFDDETFRTNHEMSALRAVEEFPTGEEVTIRVDPDEPGLARIDEPSPALPLLLGTLGLLFAGAGVGVYFVGRASGKVRRD